MKTTIIIATLAAIGAFYVLTIRQGHDWGDDFSMYIHHAKNIVEGVEYDRVGYILNPYFPDYSPRAYPPVFPLLLSTVYYWFGLDLTAMKIEIILLFLAFLLSFYIIFKQELPFHYLLAAVAVTGINPYFWEIKDQVLTDLPFLLFVYPALFFINRAYESSPSKTPQLAHAGLTGILLSLSYGMRVIGIILLPCLLIHDYIRTKRISWFAITASLVSVSLMILQSVFVRASESYLAIASLKPSVIYGNIGLSIRGLYRIWENGASDLLAIALFIILFALAALGCRARLKNRVTSFEIFAVLYLASIIVSPLVIVR